MPKRTTLQIRILPDWVNQKNEAGLDTLFRKTSEYPQPLQISYGIYKSGKIPDPSKDELLDMSRDVGLKKGFVEIIEIDSGDCLMGKYGSATFETIKFPRFQIWHLSNGKDFIFASHICEKEPTKEEVLESKIIVMNLNLITRNVSLWRLWREYIGKNISKR